MSAIAQDNYDPASAQLSPTVSYYLRKLLRGQSSLCTVPPTADFNSLLRQSYGPPEELSSALDALERLVRYHQALTSQGAQHPDELDRTEREILRILESPQPSQSPPPSSSLVRIQESGGGQDELQVLLAQRDYRVEYLRQGGKMLSQARELEPDAILIELNRPEQGLDCCQAILRDRHLQRVPLLLMSSFHSVSDRVKAFKLGVTDYIAQPAQPEEVLARLENQLQRQRQRKQLELDNRHLRLQLQQHNNGNETALLLAQEVLHGSGDYVLYVNSDNAIVAGNQAASVILGYDPNQLQQLSIGELDIHLAPEDWQTVWQHLQQHSSLSLKSVHRCQGGETREVNLEFKYVSLHGQGYSCIIAHCL